MSYRGMGLEEVPIAIQRWDGAQWVEAGAAKSGYHGSFAVRLSPGRYRLAARAVLPPGGERATLLFGRLEGLEVRAGVERVDRVVIEMATGVPAPDPSDRSTPLEPAKP